MTPMPTPAHSAEAEPDTDPAGVPMTNMNFPERWLHDRRVQLLDDRSFRAFVQVTTWCVGNRTDGAITASELDLVPGRFSTDDLEKLTTAGLYEPTDTGWSMIGYASSQTTKAQLEAAEHARVLNRDRVRRSRNKDKPGAPLSDVTAHVMPHDSGEVEVTPHVMQDSAVQNKPDQNRHVVPDPSETCSVCGQAKSMLLAGVCRACTFSARASA